MNEYLVVAVDPEAYDPELYRCVIRTGMLGEYFVLDILHTEDPTLPGDTLVGAWNKAGEQVTSFDQVLFEQIRPLGNLPTGEATDELLFHHYSGWWQRKLGSGGELYPTDNTPFPVTIKRKYFDDPTWPGHGWRMEFDAGFAASGRNPTDYFIAIYNAPECTVDDFWYQVGAFSLQPSEWQEGSPEVYAAEYNQAFIGSPDRQVIYHGMCKGSIHIQEGFGSLALDEEEDKYLFWEHNQPNEGGGSEWVDTGATVTGQAGQLFYISSASIVASLTSGQNIRFGDTLETTFTQVWPGTDNLIAIDPYVAASTGDALWIMQ
jgi:hypothetical protein